MDRSAIEALSYKDLLALKMVVDELLAVKLHEAEVEYRGRIKGIAQEYGFTLGSGLVGRDRDTLHVGSHRGVTTLLQEPIDDLAVHTL